MVYYIIDRGRDKVKNICLLIILVVSLSGCKLGESMQPMFSNVARQVSDLVHLVQSYPYSKTIQDVQHDVDTIRYSRAAEYHTIYFSVEKDKVFSVIEKLKTLSDAQDIDLREQDLKRASSSVDAEGLFIIRVPLDKMTEFIPSLQEVHAFKRHQIAKDTPQADIDYYEAEIETLSYLKESLMDYMKTAESRSLLEKKAVQRKLLQIESRLSARREALYHLINAKKEAAVTLIIEPEYYSKLSEVKALFYVFIDRFLKSSVWPVFLLGFVLPWFLFLYLVRYLRRHFYASNPKKVPALSVPKSQPLKK